MPLGEWGRQRAAVARSATRAGRMGLALVVLVWAGCSPAGDAADRPYKVGFLLPYSGTYAQLGEMITQGFELALEEAGDSLGGREVEYVRLDSQADPGRATQNMQQLVSGENVDVVVGPVHSGVAMALVRVAQQEGTLLIIPNAGLDAATRELCAPNVFRTSFSNWQPAYPMGGAAYERGHRRVVTMAWRYGAGQEAAAAFREGFEAAGGEIVREIFVPFPEVEFQAQLTEIASLRPDAVFTFFAGGGAVQFVRDWHAAGLGRTIQLLGSGFLTEGTLAAQGEAAEGVLTTLHYSESLDTEENAAFRQAFHDRYGRWPDLYAVQGYDAGQLLVQGAEAAGGADDQARLIEAMGDLRLESPRGPVTFSRAHNPTQNIYLREVRDGQNVVLGIAHEMLEDPATGCAMAEAARGP